ncbi:hypothetical protein [Segniliparus rugosus]|uniref:Uncharacterized protein n=1 Tax=Segniliparus rugosus (strain ATCC BAA-974 / DSM 45345 / CCUG 50838 / CIP 108380 / JCM 13579 / CDC 945) TaxID=679197 RepID=E5XTS0_SEGRC|nr:hypothetical protein [Segniliparus rugosus]EFV12273.1 hypothetical protein HMPREF9336_02892 [Segniliparus rugosus ATCC BAA-974]
MAGKELDRSRVGAALDVIKQHPGMALFLASPALLVFVLLWWLVHPALAVVVLLAAVGGGIYVIGRGGRSRF